MTSVPATKFGLALHTTTPQLGLGIIDLATADETIQAWDLGRALTAELQVYLRDFVSPRKWQNMAFMAVAKGPGGFTGTRVGVVTARTLAQQLDVPLYGISTLAAIAWHQGQGFIGQTIAVSLPARRGEVFGGIYRLTSAGVVVVVEDQLFLPETWETLIKTEGAILGRSPDQLGETVNSVLELAYLQWQQNPVAPWGKVVPFYGQHPVHKTPAQ
ncbi:MAG: tRNA (adenosine(37)-N6)-threonylcarbamoyltransferase complex dimerization subunit type 1 TsaB [Limnothrix sp. RL_2_0]|nr:tRNA (adenosine(37)-N6)-threonylcarbamoyltransferase complex dimerization subunit type 1 TsaB [Limnothrix sp. RL_2_0]